MTFPPDFLWGAATASYQVEGAGSEDGRKPCIWDTFCGTPGKVHAGDNGMVSCNQYHHFEEDIKLMADAGIRSYRFSLAWPRIIPDGTGAVNQSGIEYYHRLIASLKKAGIEPAITLYHWDLPQCLQDSGGWANRETVEAFAEFARICYEAFGSSVSKWFTINEPFCVAYLGYLQGVHAPGLREPSGAYKAVHNVNLAHGRAVQLFRSMKVNGTIGIVWNLVTPRPATRRAEDIKAAELRRDHDTAMFTSPVLGKGYPESMKEFCRHMQIEKGDMAVIASPIDFIGINYYSESPVFAGKNGEAQSAPTWERQTDMGWPVVPLGLLRQLRWIHMEAPGIPLYITENGSAEKDTPIIETGGVRRVHDVNRIEYLHAHFKVMEQAIKENIPLRGYFIWSLLDNFEWAYGYSKRFGIIYCDFQTLERIPKDSYYYYRDVIAGYGEL